MSGRGKGRTGGTNAQGAWVRGDRLCLPAEVEKWGRGLLGKSRGGCNRGGALQIIGGVLAFRKRKTLLGGRLTGW